MASIYYDHSGRIHLFIGNVLNQFFSDVKCDCATNNFASFQNLAAWNQLNPIRIGCSRAFTFYARWLDCKERHPRDQFFNRSFSSRQISLSMENELSNGVFEFRRWCHGCVLMTISKFRYVVKVRSDGC